MCKSKPHCNGGTIVRVLTGIVVFVAAITVLGKLVQGLPETEAGAATVVGFPGILLVLIPLVNRFLYGKKYGYGDGGCTACGGAGRFYQGGRHPSTSRCST